MRKLVALQMDPIETIDVNGDSSFVLGLEAQNRGYDLVHYLPNDLSLIDGKVVARVRPLTLTKGVQPFFALGTPMKLNLAEATIVLMRQDPPFDMSYVTLTHMLEHIHPKTLVVNDPFHVRNAPEKLLVTLFPHLMPKTLITRNAQEIHAFRNEFKDIIIKPLYGNGGTGVFHITPEDENLNVVLEMFQQTFREPFIIQRYLPEVRQGDKRIILVDGKAMGAINRIPVAGESRSNMHVGGHVEASALTKRDREICETIGPVLQERGLIFTGIDVIGDFLTEINVTSPTGLQEIARFNGVNLEKNIWDAIEARCQ